MESTKAALLAMLDKIAASPPPDVEEHWSAYMKEARKLLLASDYGELEKLLGWNDSLGSFEGELEKLREKLEDESWANLENVLGGSN